MDQVDRVLYDLKHNPASRRILTNIYNFQDLHEMAPVPLRLLHDVQRLRTYPQRHPEPAQPGHAGRQQLERGAVQPCWSTCWPRSSGLEAGELVHVIADAHIYDRHVPIIEKLLEQDAASPRRSFVMDPSVTDFYAVHPGQLLAGGLRSPAPFEDKIPVAI